MNRPSSPSPTGSRPAGGVSRSPVSRAGHRLSGADRAAAVARTYARGTRRLRLTESQLRYIARLEGAGQERVRPTVGG